MTEVSKKRLNILPENPEQSKSDTAVGLGRFPSWLHRKLPKGNLLWETHSVLNHNRLPTVCEEAKCPNLTECYSNKTATFLSMGKECTRNCGFCDIDFSKAPKPLEEDEPIRIALSAKELGLKHVVITMVARDDMEDGGASHLVKIIQEIRVHNPLSTVEVLTSDFGGNEKSVELVLNAKPEIFNHNIETVRALTPRVRHKASYDRTLAIIQWARQKTKGSWIKSGIMVGLGETSDEVKETIVDLYNAGCDIITIGHYLQPNRKKLSVKAFIEPNRFQEYADFGHSLGVKAVYSGPFVRSSYNAAALFNNLSENFSL